MNIDIQILDFIHNNCTSAVLDKLMIFLSVICDHGEIWIAVALVLFFLKQGYIDENHKHYLLKKYRIYGLMLIVAIVLAFLVSQVVLKGLVNRPRPFSLRPDIAIIIPEPLGSSFPSAHSAVSFASAFVLLMLNRRLGVAAYILATLIAFSRLYLFVHYPTDVLAGIIIGSLISVCVYFIFKNILYKKLKLCEKSNERDKLFAKT